MCARAHARVQAGIIILTNQPREEKKEKMNAENTTTSIRSDGKGESFVPSLPPSSGTNTRLSFKDAQRKAAAQLEYPRCYSTFEADELRELVMIIAEVYLLPSEKPIRISGEWIDGFVVKEVFEELRGDHLRHVYEEYVHRDPSTPIMNKKAYLRTMLYNSVFSVGTHLSAEVYSDFRGGI